MDRYLIALGIALCIALTTSSAVAELKVLDKPLWILPGQQFRVCLEQPEGSGTLQVTGYMGPGRHPALLLPLAGAR